MSSFEFLSLAVWIGVVALQLADLMLRVGRVPTPSALGLLRDELQDAAGARISAEQLDDFRDRLAALDERGLARSQPQLRGMNAQLWRRVPWQLAAVALSLLPLISTLSIHGATVAATLTGLALPPIAYLLALAVARASITAAGARSIRHAHERAEVIDLLEIAEKSSRKKVAGLGDRVARALHILRQQQSE